MGHFRTLHPESCPLCPGIAEFPRPAPTVPRPHQTLAQGPKRAWRRSCELGGGYFGVAPPPPGGKGGSSFSIPPAQLIALPHPKKNGFHGNGMPFRVTITLMANRLLGSMDVIQHTTSPHENQKHQQSCTFCGLGNWFVGLLISKSLGFLNCFPLLGVNWLSKWWFWGLKSADPTTISPLENKKPQQMISICRGCGLFVIRFASGAASASDHSLAADRAG